MSRKPYRGVDPQKPLQTGAYDTLGFIQTVEGKVRQLAVQVAGLKDRLKYKYGKGVPAAYVGERVFKPEDSVVDVDPRRVGFDEPLEPCNYIVRDGQLNDVQIILDGPGVFLARYLTVTFYQRLHLRAASGPTVSIPRAQEVFYEVPQTRAFLPIEDYLGNIQAQTGKVSLANQVDLDDFQEDFFQDRKRIGTNFFWNLIDRDSDRRLSNELISSHALLPGSFQNQLDGDLFELPVPWLFERANVVNFQFQLINPILQLAATSPISPFVDVNDLEDGKRNQSVTVRVELHGTKFYSERDLLLREMV